MIKRMIIMLVLCGIVFGSIFGFKAFGMKMMMEGMSKMGDQPQTVSTIQASKQKWQSEIKVVGSLRAAQGADLASEVNGTVEHIFIESGQDVTAGTVLLQLSSKEEQAKLRSLTAQTKLAKLTLERDKKQLAVQAISQATYDTDKANLDSLEAQMEEQRAFLQKKNIVAPFDGRLGLRKVDVGQFLSAGEAIVTLQQLNPIYLDFFLPQQKIGALHVGQKVKMVADSIEGESFTGEITAINAKVDEITRNIEVRATFKNAEKKLRPGMFASAVITTGEAKEYITLPQTAVIFNPYGNTVFTLSTTKKTGPTGDVYKVKSAFVKTGLTRGDQVVILSGVEEGMSVVTAGQLKLRNGSNVTINNTLQPTNDKNPTPKDN